MDVLGLPLDAFIGLVAFFILNVIINLYLINRIFSEQRKNRMLKKSLSSEDSKVKDFFDSQVKWSRAKIKPDLELQAKQAWNLRVAYGKIESKALDLKVGSPEYEANLVDPLIKLLKTLIPSSVDDGKNHLRNQLAALETRIKKLPIGADKAQVKEKALKTLSNYKQQVDSSGQSPSALAGKVEKLSGLMSLFEDPVARRKYVKNKLKTKYVNESVNPIKRLSKSQVDGAQQITKFEKDVQGSEGSGSSKELLDEIQRFKEENKKLQEHIKELKKNMVSIKSAVPESPPEPFFSPPKNVEVSNDDYSDSLLEANEKEIDRLREVISNQRRSILEMEESVSKFEGVNLDTGDGADQIEKMKQCIKESETCITILENELESLKNSLDELREEQEEELSHVDVEQLNSDLERAQLELKVGEASNSRLKSVLDFVKELFSAKTVEDISLLVYECISNANYSPNIIIKSGSRDLVVSSTGEISVRDKVTINNMRINEMNVGKGGQLSFRLSHLAGVIRSSDAELTSEEVTKEVIIDILRFADQCVDLLIKSQSGMAKGDVVEMAVTGLKDIAFNVDKMLDDQSARTEKLVKTNIEQILDVAKAKGVNASIIAKINQIEQETVRQMANENTIKIKTRRQLLALVNELEKTKK